MGGSSTISSSETRVEALKLQSSSMGAACTVLHGTHRIPPNLVDFGDFSAIAHTTRQKSGGKGGGGGVTMQNTTYTYTASAVLALCVGQIKDTGTIWRGKERWPAGQGPSAKRLTVMFGTLDQPVWSVLNTMHGGAHAQNYSGMALFCMQDYDLGSSATMENHNIEVMGPCSLMPEAYVLDANPAHIAAEWLCHPTRGLGLSSEVLAEMTRYRDYCYAAGLLLSTPLTEQMPAADRFNKLGLLTNSTTVVMDGQVHAVPLGTEPLSRGYPSSVGSTVTYTYEPDNTPLYSLTPDHLLDRGDQPLVTIRRKSPADAYNIVNVEYRDRAGDYAVGCATAKDQPSIDQVGEKPADTVDAPWITDHETADRLAWLLLQRYQQVLNEYDFELPWNFAALVPTNIVELTDPDWELDEIPVQILNMKETERGFEITAEDFVGPVSAQPTYELPGMDAFRQDYAAVPGDTVVSAVFEAPHSLTETGLEVWLAVKGAAAGWGGCNIWVSADGAEYRRADTQWGASRVGVVANVVTSTATSMNVSGMTAELLSGSALDASVGATLCYVGGGNPEYVAYQTASLAGVGAYSLGGVVRGVYGATAKLHQPDDAFVRCDEAVAKSGPLPLSMIGRQIYIKCQSFNQFGKNEQELADIDPITYTITGKWAVPIDEPVNLCTEGSFSQLPLGERPGTWDGGTVQTVAGQAFARALRVTALITEQVGGKIGALEGDRFHVMGLLEGASSNVTTALGLRFYDANDAFLSFVQAGTALAAGAGWTARSGVVVAPASSAYAKVAIVRGVGPTGYAQAAEITVRRQAKTEELSDNAATKVLQTSLEAGRTSELSATPYVTEPVQAEWMVLIHINFFWSATQSDPGTAVVRGSCFPEAFVAGGSLVAVGDASSFGFSSAVLSQNQSASGFGARTYQYRITGAGTLNVRGRMSMREVISGVPSMGADVQNFKVVVEIIKV